jgi:hypothetical protein
MLGPDHWRSGRGSGKRRGGSVIAFAGGFEPRQACRQIMGTLVTPATLAFVHITWDDDERKLAFPTLAAAARQLIGGHKSA